MPRFFVVSLVATIVLVSLTPSGAFAQAGWIFAGADSSFALLHEPVAKGGVLSSPYRFPPDWNPGHRYPDPAANGWNFAENSGTGVMSPMTWDAGSQQWVGPGGATIGQTEIRPNGPNTAKLCIHADVDGDTGVGQGTYTVRIHVRALPGGASLRVFRANSNLSDPSLPDESTAMDIVQNFVLEGNERCDIDVPGVPISECQWIVFEVDDPSVGVAPRTWGRLKSTYR